MGQGHSRGGASLLDYKCSTVRDTIWVRRYTPAICMAVCVCVCVSTCVCVCVCVCVVINTVLSACFVMRVLDCSRQLACVRMNMRARGACT